MCVFYGRDRKENGTQCIVSENLQEFIELSFFEDYCYIFEAGVWFLIEMNVNKKPVKLSEFLQGETTEE